MNLFTSALSIIRKGVINPIRNSNKDVAVPFTEALTHTKFGIFNYFIIFISGIEFFSVFLETAGMGFILPIAQCDLLMTNTDKGILSAMGYLGIILSSHLWGFLADTKGRRRVIRPTVFAGFIVTLLSSFAHKFWLMVLLRFINGIFISGGSATIYAYLGEFHTDKTRSRAMMGSAFVFSIAAMLIPLMAFGVINQDWILPIEFLGIEYKPWRLFILVCGLPGLVCGISLCILPESPKFLLSNGEDDKAVAALRQMLHWNTFKKELPFTKILPEADDSNGTILINQKGKNSNLFAVFIRTMWTQTAPLFSKKYLRVTLIICIIQFWLFVVVNGLYVWFPYIISSMAEFMRKYPGEDKRICEIVADKHEEIYKADGSIECMTKLENATYFYTFLMEGLYAVAFAFIGLIITRVGKIKILSSVMILCSGFGVAAVLLPDPKVSSYLYVLFFLVGVDVNVLGAATVELYPTNLRAMAICISMMVGRAGSVVGANFVGMLLARNCELTFYISCGAMAVCSFLAVFIPRRTILEQELEKVKETENS